MVGVPGILARIFGIRAGGRGGRGGGQEIQFCSSTGAENTVYRSTGTEKCSFAVLPGPCIKNPMY